MLKLSNFLLPEHRAAHARALASLLCSEQLHKNIAGVTTESQSRFASALAQVLDDEENGVHAREERMRQEKREIESRVSRLELERQQLEKSQSSIREKEANLKLDRQQVEKDRHDLQNERKVGVCVICQDSNSTCAFLPCMHMCLCKECVQLASQIKECPICRTTAEGIREVYAV